MVVKLANYFEVNEDDLLVAWLSDKVVYELEHEEVALKALQAAEEKVSYLLFKKLDRNEILKQLKTGIKGFPQIQKPRYMVLFT